MAGGLLAAAGLLVPSAHATVQTGADREPTAAAATREADLVEPRPAFTFRSRPSEETGVTFVHRSGAEGTGKRFMIECVGAGVGLFDVDDDGDLDLYLPQGCEVGPRGKPRGGPHARDALFQNDGAGHFLDVGEEAGELSEGFGFGVTAADVDGDGDEDVFVACLGPNDLLQNDGTGFFARREEAGGLVGAPDDWSMGAAFGDVDRDGDLDAYVSNYLSHDLQHPMLGGHPCRWLGCEVPCGPQGLEAQSDRFYLNDGHGTFLEITGDTVFASVDAAYAFQPVFSDLDDDGDLDLFVANDSVPNGFYLNEGVGDDGLPRFAEQAMRSGLALSDTGKEQAGMGVAVGDVDGDLLLDIVMTNFSREPNALFHNASRQPFGALFFDEAGRFGVGRPSYHDLGWGACLFDADLDGDLDLFVANGHVYPHVDGCDISSTTFAQRDQLYGQGEGGRFVVCTDEAGPALAKALPSRGAAAGDLDGDGDVDLVVSVLDGPPVVLENQTERRGDWILLDLRPMAASVGARVHLEGGGRTRVAEVRRGSSFLGTEDRRLHFGLPSGAEQVAAHVRWPDGSEEAWPALRPGRTVVLTKGDGAR